jgi:hypothetical protein
MLRAAVIWRVPALRMKDVPCPGPAELRRIGQLGRLGHRFQQETAVNSRLELGRMVWLSCPDWAMPIVHPPAYRPACEPACSWPTPGHLSKRPFIDPLLNCKMTQQERCRPSCRQNAAKRRKTPRKGL